MTFMNINKVCALGASVIGLLVQPGVASAQALTLSKSGQTKCEGTQASGTHAPTPNDPYPLNASGWGPDLSSNGWKPRLNAHIDMAFGGGAYGTEHSRASTSFMQAQTILVKVSFLA